ncbi:MAG: hypothetical protein JOZ51_27655 [Chloroflexi bacterium]|nr:hypothetical protein [Chloroflexota bacterium]
MLVLPACSSSTQPALIVGPAVAGLTTTLQDELHDLPDARLAWSTFWQLCWSAYPSATAYELESLTSEGASPVLRRQQDTCYRIQAAAGENAKSEGLAGRDMQLLIQSGQLGYRVRAVLPGNQVSEWSVPVAVGVDL